MCRRKGVKYQQPKKEMKKKNKMLISVPMDTLTTYDNISKSYYNIFFTIKKYFFKLKAHASYSILFLEHNSSARYNRFKKKPTCSIYVYSMYTRNIHSNSMYGVDWYLIHTFFAVHTIRVSWKVFWRAEETSR